MSQVPIWFERKFEFSFPVELLPNLCARLRGTPARLEDMLRGGSFKILTENRRTNGRLRNTPVIYLTWNPCGWRE
jgi:hypothetical protein